MPTTPLPDILTVLPWHDPVVDHRGHDPRAGYVEQFWLGILGPSASWLLRRLTTAFDDDPDGFVISPADLAAELGLGRGIGGNAPITRTIDRLCMFGMAQRSGDELMVRRRVPSLDRRQVARLPERLGRSHEYLEALADDEQHREDERRRARRLALTLVELGENRSATESQLQCWRFSPDTSRDATEWARQRHHAAAATVAAG
ncbi:MAG: hypothetical protein OEU32_17245 [Acidimicrobiia bacterium]|nr:hypothetical protein [Acidimicrobiia bacterium]